MAEVTKINFKGTVLDIRDADAARASALATKQDVISDLSAIRSGAAAGATALQSHQPLKTINGQSLVGNGNITVVGEKGDKGDTGNVTVTDGVAQITIVNDLTTGGTGDALSAEMGKYLGQTALVGMGTFAQAYVKSQSNHDLWCWMLNDMVDGEVIRKPIWHVGSSTFVDAVGSVVSIAIAPPAEPVFSLDDSEDVLSGSTLNVTFFGTLHYIIDGGTEQTTSTSPLALTLNADTDIEAWVEDSIGLLSQHVTKSYSIAIDHKLVFKIKLSGDNSTEYVPVTYQPIPGFSSNTYTMSVDWGDGTVDNFSNKGFTRKGCSHTYTGAAGDEKTITLRGSAIPALYFGASATGMTSDNYGNADALVAILENTLECDTYITINGGCSSLSADALSNNVGTKALRFSGITSFPTGLLNHLSKTGITEFSNMFVYGVTTFTAENMQELRESLASATDCISMFYGFNGVCSLPSNLFDLVGNGAITSCRYMTHTAKSGLTGDAKALYDVLSTKVTSSATTTGCFNATSLTNRNQVPNAWGGTAG